MNGRKSKQRGAGNMIRKLTIAALAAAAALLPAESAGAYTFHVLYSFCGVAFCTNGEGPEGPLLLEPTGNLIGTASGGGADQAGAVFELSFDGSNWNEQVLYSFCSTPGCPEGDFPGSGVIMDTAGDLYGTTTDSTTRGGTAFELIPNADRSQWMVKVLYAFCSETNCADGAVPNGLTYAGAESGALYDGVSPLYGTTIEGGPDNSGLVFELIPGRRKWKERTIHTFCNCTTDGGRPEASLLADGGNLYGTTTSGGTHNSGTVFRLKPKPASLNWKFSILYSFCSQLSCSDGSDPTAPLIKDATGALLGTAGDVVFSLPAQGKHAVLAVLYTFCKDGTCSDGSQPSGLTLDSSGNLFGTTRLGGTDFDGGTVFELSGATFHQLYVFCSNGGSCKDGKYPGSGIALDSAGNLFGTTFQFGEHGAGNAFELTP